MFPVYCVDDGVLGARASRPHLRPGKQPRHPPATWIDQIGAFTGISFIVPGRVRAGRPRDEEDLSMAYPYGQVLRRFAAPLEPRADARGLSIGKSHPPAVL